MHYLQHCTPFIRHHNTRCRINIFPDIDNFSIAIRIIGSGQVTKRNICGCCTFCIVTIGDYPDLYAWSVNPITQPGKIRPHCFIALTLCKSGLLYRIVPDSRENRSCIIQSCRQTVHIKQPGNGYPSCQLFGCSIFKNLFKAQSCELRQQTGCCSKGYCLHIDLVNSILHSELENIIWRGIEIRRQTYVFIVKRCELSTNERSVIYLTSCRRCIIGNNCADITAMVRINIGRHNFYCPIGKSDCPFNPVLDWKILSENICLQPRCKWIYF